MAAAAAAFWAAAEETPGTTEADALEEVPVVEETVVEEDLPVVEEMTGFEEIAGLEEAAGFEEAAESTPAASDSMAGVANDLVARSTDEQRAKLDTLKPDDLTKVFRTTNDTRLKKSIIDTLEHRGFLDTIHEFFDDPDPEVQRHALDAADRLLGADD